MEGGFMEIIYIIYGMFSLGFGIGYGGSMKSAWDKIGVSILGTLFCPFLLGVLIVACVEKYINE